MRKADTLTRVRCRECGQRMRETFVPDLGDSVLICPRCDVRGSRLPRMIDSEGAPIPGAEAYLPASHPDYEPPARPFWDGAGFLLVMGTSIVIGAVAAAGVLGGVVVVVLALVWWFSDPDERRRLRR